MNNRTIFISGRFSYLIIGSLFHDFILMKEKSIGMHEI